MSKADELQERTDAFADRSIKLVQGLPEAPIARRLGGQYQDCSTSVAANYRAARRGRSHAEFTSKIGIVSEEADESVFWLKRMVNAGIRSSERRSNRSLPKPKSWRVSSAHLTERQNGENI